MAKTVKEWLNLKSANFKTIEDQKKRIEDSIDHLEKDKTVDKAAFTSVRTMFPSLQKIIDVVKVSINTDNKKLEIVQAALGKDTLDKKLIDQKLVSTVVDGFAKAKADIKLMGDILSKDYEKRIAKIEQKRLK